MRRSKYVLVLLLTIFCAALLIAPSRSRAITYGFIDSNNTYSNTGAFIVKSPTTGPLHGLLHQHPCAAWLYSLREFRSFNPFWGIDQ